jgi:hypothetical protein
MVRMLTITGQNREKSGRILLSTELMQIGSFCLSKGGWISVKAGHNVGSFEKGDRPQNGRGRPGCP